MKKKKKSKAEICPFCGSRDITYHDSEIIDELYCYDVTCNQCDKNFEEIYELKFSYHADENGDIIE